MGTPRARCPGGLAAYGRTPARSDFHQFEVFLAGTAFGTDPIGRNVFPARAGSDAFVRQAGLFIVYPTADYAHPSTHKFSFICYIKSPPPGRGAKRVAHPLEWGNLTETQ